MSASEKASAAKGKTAPQTKIAICVAAVAVVVAIASVAFVFTRDNGSDASGLTYGSNIGVVTSQEELDAAMAAAAANAADRQIALKYQNDAESSDGKTFECYLMNSENNLYDAFFTIFADANLTDQLFLSDLVPRGSGFTEITLDRALEEGDHTVYVVITLVKTDEDGTESIASQATYTMDFHVSSD